MLVGAKASFCASHTLPQHGGIHGHSYEVWAYAIEGVCAETLQDDLRTVIDSLDHSHLNEVMTAPPTMENIARWIAERMPGLRKVVIMRPVEGLCCEWVPECIW